jgi:hypothetical protein
VQSFGKSGSINSRAQCKNLSLVTIKSGGVHERQIARFMVQLRLFPPSMFVFLRKLCIDGATPRLRDGLAERQSVATSRPVLSSLITSPEAGDLSFALFA